MMRLILSPIVLGLALLCVASGCAGLPTRESQTVRPDLSRASLDHPEAGPDEAAPVTEAKKSQGIRRVSLKRAISPQPTLATRPSDDSLGTDSEGAAVETALDLEPTSHAPTDVIELNLPTALSLVGAQHPLVGFAQWRVQEAYARLDRANVLWLPTLQTGFSFHRHDGNYQASGGSIVDVNRNSFQYGLGTGATGAGTTPGPGVRAAFHLADAVFQPKISQRVAWARGHAAHGSINNQLLAVALAYYDLLDAVQNHQIIDEALDRTKVLAKITSDYAESGQGLQADADRLNTEATLTQDRLYSASEQIEIASASLAQALSIRSGQAIRPLDVTATPIEMVPPTMDRTELISTGLHCRPELKEAQALVAAACEQYRREKHAPFVPSMLLGFSTGGFGGGPGENVREVDSRYDFDAIVTWQLRNMGRGEKAARREAQARLQQAKYEKIGILDRVAREVSEAHSQVTHRSNRIAITHAAVETAANSHARNLSRIRDGQGLPLEVLQSVGALEEAQRAHLRAVTQFNQSQFRLHWAIGCKLSRLDDIPPSANDGNDPSRL